MPQDRHVHDDLGTTNNPLRTPAAKCLGLYAIVHAIRTNSTSYKFVNKIQSMSRNGSRKARAADG